MIKGMTLVRVVAAPDELSRLSELFASLGFEAGKGWSDAHEGTSSIGAPFLAPLGNLELISGAQPATPELLIEVTGLELIPAAVKRWLSTFVRPEEIASRLSEVAPTHWNSRLFTAQLSENLTLAFWQSEDPFHGQLSEGIAPAIEGSLSAAGMRFAIVTTRWNTVITDRLLQGSLDCLLRSGAARKDITVVRVPGAWEIPNAARTLAESGAHHAIITLGCLLRGETAHYEAIYNEVARGIGQSQQETGIPHAFGVLTCETLEQALDRAGLKAGNKGFEAASAAIEMVSIQRKLKGAA